MGEITPIVPGQDDAESQPKSKQPLFIAVAVLLILLLAGGTWFVLSRSGKKDEKPPVVAQQDEYPNVLETDRESSPILNRTPTDPLAVSELMKLPADFKVNTAPVFSVNNDMLTTEKLDLSIPEVAAEYANNDVNMKLFAKSEAARKVQLEAVAPAISSVFDSSADLAGFKKNLSEDSAVTAEVKKNISNVKFTSTDSGLRTQAVFNAEQSPLQKPVIIGAFFYTGTMDYGVTKGATFEYYLYVVSDESGKVYQVKEEILDVSSNGQVIASVRQ